MKPILFFIFLMLVYTFSCSTPSVDNREGVKEGGDVLPNDSMQDSISKEDSPDGKNVFATIKTKYDTPAKILAVSFSPDGKTLASGDTAGGLKLWEVASRKLLKIINSGGFRIAFSPDGKIIATNSGLWDTSSGKMLKELYSVIDISFGTDVMFAYVKKNSNIVYVMNPQTGVIIKKLFNREWGFYAKSVGFSNNSRLLVSGDMRPSRQIWKIWDWSLVEGYIPRSNDTSSIVFIPDDSLFASIDNENGGIEIIRDEGYPNGWREFKVFRGHSPTCLAFSPDGKVLAAGSNYNYIVLFDTSTWKELKTLKGHNKEVNSISFSPDGKTLASGSSDGTIRFWTYP